MNDPRQIAVSGVSKVILWPAVLRFAHSILRVLVEQRRYYKQSIDFENVNYISKDYNENDFLDSS